MKKLIYSIGVTLATISPIVGVVSCGSKAKSELPGLSKGDYAHFTFPKSDVLFNKPAQLVKMPNELGYKYVIQTDDAKYTSTNYNAVDQTLSLEVVNKLLQQEDFCEKITGTGKYKDRISKFEFITIVITDTKDYGIKSTKSVFIPYIPFLNGETQELWISRARTIIDKILKDQKISYLLRNIPVAVYDAPSYRALQINKVYKTAIVTGMRSPILKADGKLDDQQKEAVITGFMNSNEVINMLMDNSVDLGISFANEMFLEQISSTLNINKETIPTNITREQSWVVFNPENSMTVPVAHVSQNPVNLDRTTAYVRDKVDQVTMHKADPRMNMKYEGNGNTNSYTFTVLSNEPIAVDHFSEAIASQVARAAVNNQIIKNTINDGSQFLRVEVVSEQAINNEYNTLFEKIKNGQIIVTDSWKDLKNDSNNNPIPGSEGPDPADADAYNVFKALDQLSKKWWTAGSFKDSSQNIGYEEIKDIVTRDETQFTLLTGKDLENYYIVKTLFELSLKEIIKDKNTRVLDQSKAFKLDSSNLDEQKIKDIILQNTVGEKWS